MDGWIKAGFQSGWGGLLLVWRRRGVPQYILSTGGRPPSTVHRDLPVQRWTYGGRKRSLLESTRGLEWKGIGFRLGGHQEAELFAVLAGLRNLASRRECGQNYVVFTDS